MKKNILDEKVNDVLPKNDTLNLNIQIMKPDCFFKKQIENAHSEILKCPPEN